MQGDSQLVGRVRVKWLPHLDKQLGGAGDRTRNLPVATHLLYLLI
jgi:hypothetical protein